LIEASDGRTQLLVIHGKEIERIRLNGDELRRLAVQVGDPRAERGHLNERALCIEAEIDAVQLGDQTFGIVGLLEPHGWRR
jgi:hypothetical protein